MVTEKFVFLQKITTAFKLIWFFYVFGCLIMTMIKNGKNGKKKITPII